MGPDNMSTDLMIYDMFCANLSPQNKTIAASDCLLVAGRTELMIQIAEVCRKWRIKSRNHSVGCQFRAGFKQQQFIVKVISNRYLSNSSK